MKISKPMRLLQGSLLVAALAFAGRLARANDLFTNSRGSEPPIVLAQAQENEAAEKAKAAQLQGQIRGDEAELRQMQAEEAREEAEAKKKGVPVPPNVLKLRQAIRDIEAAQAILRALPHHYEGYKQYAYGETQKAVNALFRCRAIDWALAGQGKMPH